jgi:hypothetical protein
LKESRLGKAIDLLFIFIFIFIFCLYNNQGTYAYSETWLLKSCVKKWYNYQPIVLKKMSQK